LCINHYENESNNKLKTYSLTRPVRLNDQKFGFAWNWADDDDEEKEEPIFDKSSKERKIIRTHFSSIKISQTSF
jgi:hypothetical protein